MRTPKLLLLAGLLTALLPGTTRAAGVYFQNASGASGVVNVYVDGQLMFDHIFPASFMMFPRQMARGTYQVIVTPSHLALGQADLLKASITVDGDGPYTLKFANDKDDPDKLTLKIKAGAQK